MHLGLAYKARHEQLTSSISAHIHQHYKSKDATDHDLTDFNKWKQEGEQSRRLSSMHR